MGRLTAFFLSWGALDSDISDGCRTLLLVGIRVLTHVGGPLLLHGALQRAGSEVTIPARLDPRVAAAAAAPLKQLVVIADTFLASHTVLSALVFKRFTDVALVFTLC